MTGLFGTLGTATRGMNSNQNALQTSGHNIANINTPGYSRQRTRIQTEQPYIMAGIGAMGTGSRTTGVDRIVDNFIQVQTQGAYSKFRFFEQKANALGQLEQYMNEPSETGLLNQLSVLHDSWAKLGSNPELGTAKTLVVENSNTFADMINQTKVQIEKLNSELTDSVDKSVLDLNEKLKHLETLNKQIYDLASQNVVPNDLLDSRDLLLKDISGLAEIDSKFDMYGRVSSLKIGGTEVLEGGRKEIAVVTGAGQVSTGGNQQLDVTFDGTIPVGSIVVIDPNKTDPDKLLVEAGDIADIKQGMIGGYQEAAKEVKERLAEFDAFITSVVDTINTVYNKTKNADNNFFFFTDGKLEVNQELSEDPSKLVVGNPDHPGDGSLATSISELFSKKGDDNMTFAERYNNIVTKNGISKQQADNTADAQLTVLNQLEIQNESVSGVNINEEVSDVMRFSQAFQANARVLQTISEMLDTLINRTGV